MTALVALGFLASVLGGWLIQPYLVRRPEPKVITKTVRRQSLRDYLTVDDERALRQWNTREGQAAFNRKVDQWYGRDW